MVPDEIFDGNLMTQKFKVIIPISQAKPIIAILLSASIQCSVFGKEAQKHD